MFNTFLTTIAIVVGIIVAWKGMQIAGVLLVAFIEVCENLYYKYLNRQFEKNKAKNKSKKV